MNTELYIEYQPLHDRLIVKPDDAEEKTAGGIIIPDKHQQRPSRGIVIAAGPGLPDRPMQVKKGDRIVHQKHGGTPITLEGLGDVLIIREDDVLSIVTSVTASEQAG